MKELEKVTTRVPTQTLLPSEESGLNSMREKLPNRQQLPEEIGDKVVHGTTKHSLKEKVLEKSDQLVRTALSGFGQKGPGKTYTCISWDRLKWF